MGETLAIGRADGHANDVPCSNLLAGEIKAGKSDLGDLGYGELDN